MSKIWKIWINKRTIIETVKFYTALSKTNNRFKKKTIVIFGCLSFHWKDLDILMKVIPEQLIMRSTDSVSGRLHFNGQRPLFLFWRKKVWQTFLWRYLCHRISWTWILYFRRCILQFDPSLGFQRDAVLIYAMNSLNLTADNMKEFV